MVLLHRCALENFDPSGSLTPSLSRIPDYSAPHCCIGNLPLRIDGAASSSSG